MVVEFTIETALRGFPVSHRRLKEHVDAICRGKLGERFPESGVGKEWTHRFVERHSDRLRPYWTHSLDHSRARAVNPATKKAYFELLKKTIEGEGGEDEAEVWKAFSTMNTYRQHVRPSCGLRSMGAVISYY